MDKVHSEAFTLWSTTENPDNAAMDTQGLPTGGRGVRARRTAMQINMVLCDSDTRRNQT